MRSLEARYASNRARVVHHERCLEFPQGADHIITLVWEGAGRFGPLGPTPLQGMIVAPSHHVMGLVQDCPAVAG
jgi:hypothetical protein